MENGLKRNGEIDDSEEGKKKQLKTCKYICMYIFVTPWLLWNQSELDKKKTVWSLAGNGQDKRNNRLGEKIVMNKGGKRRMKMWPHTCFSNIFAILEPLEYIKFLQIRDI